MRRISIAVFATILLSACLLSAQETDRDSSQARRTIPPPSTVTGSGTTNYIAIWTGSTTLANSAMYQTGGRVGIGTTSPVATLDVNAGTVNAASYNIGNVTMLSVGANSSAGNIFVGNSAGDHITNGGLDSFVGDVAGAANTSGYGNTFMGGYAGSANMTGGWNSFFGAYAGNATTTGDWNTFLGASSGADNTAGFFNTYIGTAAGAYITAGNYNTEIGYYAGLNSTSGTNNIYIGNYGCASPCTESNTIRIGADANGGYAVQTAAYISGIYDATAAGGVPVYVNVYGQLGTYSSSARFKEQVRDMGDSTDALMKLRPVTFVYKPEYAGGERALQYGLIAEEVAKVYPELVAYDNDGQPYSVRYQYLSTMLLNEVQKQYRRAEQQSEIVATQQARITAQQSEIEGLKQQLQLQDAAFEQRLSRLERLAASQTVAQK